MSNCTIGNDWDNLLKEEYHKPYFIKLMQFMEQEYQKQTCYPPYNDIFNALKLTSYKNVKVVIFGQDPYHQMNQAHGLAFSVQKKMKIPKSLHNIFVELINDVNITYPTHGNLESWANQGVLLLNTVLTVRDSTPGSHRNQGWEIFTNQIINQLNDKKDTIVYLLWGNDAKNKKSLIKNQNHYILESVHPSPLSAHRGFFGCNHFSKINEILRKSGLTPINWQI